MMRTYLTLIIISMTLTGCGSFGKKLKSFLGGESSEAESQAKARTVKFSDRPNLGYQGQPRNYQRMTKEKFEEQARVNERDGSLWVMEGQGSYLFSQNTLRLVGDILNVQMEGAPQKQLQTKVDVIKKLMAKLDKPKRKPAAVAPAVPGQPPQPGQPAVAQAPGAPAPEEAGSSIDPAKLGDKEESGGSFGVDLVPVRIVDRTVDGYYRVKGAQNFMIGKREYKVIVTGLVRASDINNDTVPAQSVLEPKFDVVSLKKELKL